MKKTILAAILLLAPMAMFAQDGTYTIKGEVAKLNAPAKVYLTYRTATAIIIDSSAIVDGKFEFKGSVGAPIKAALVLNHKGTGARSRTLPNLQVYLESAVIGITAKDSLKGAKFTGSKLNTDNQNYINALKPSADKMAAFNAEFSALPADKQKDEAVRAPFGVRYAAITAEQEAATLAFIKSNPSSVISLDAIIALGGSIPDYQKVAPLYEALTSDVKNSTAGKAFAASLDKMKLTMVGAIAPEFTQNDPNGNPVKLSDFRGKYVLIDFWASWCGPCRAENPNVVKAFNEFKDKGFTVLGVSLDNEQGRQNWLNAIEKDGLTWTQVSDLKYWNNEVSTMYGIRSIPQNLLLDPNGKILAKNLRGKALLDKLAEILK
ncbi:MAG: alkyl hydroperoxide reductase [Bacteroidetes bacterium HGW-Bacteroidetes-8]|jgi:peroxiredoxin|nr:MAG: alkyl hydroperoxide reductase [Bacteroidetes bacterium HGW-Bacteroidetes-8]